MQFPQATRKIPSHHDERDSLLLASIRRVNLNAFWSRASSTVKSNALTVEHALWLSESVGLSGAFLEPGPLTAYDHGGFATAIQMVLASKTLAPQVTHSGILFRSCALPI